MATWIWSTSPSFSGSGSDRQGAPAPAGTLWRTARNVIRLTFDRDLTVPAPG
jgi:hypothetical protein